MRFKKLMLALGLIVLATLSLERASAEVKGMSVEIKGLKCEFCVKKAESSLKDIDWIKSAHVDLDASVAHITVKERKSINLNELNQKIKDSGFNPEKVKLAVTGNLTEYNGYTALKATGSDQVFILKELKETFLEGEGKVKVTGFAHLDEGLPIAISVESVEKIE